MDIEKMIEQFRTAADKWEAGHQIILTGELRVQDALRDAATALSTLQAVSREQVEKVWRGEWQMVSNGSGVCSECHRQDKIDPLAKFCRYCGAPMTDEAVEMVMRRLEALKDGSTTD